MHDKLTLEQCCSVFGESEWASLAAFHNDLFFSAYIAFGFHIALLCCSDNIPYSLLYDTIYIQ